MPFDSPPAIVQPDAAAAEAADANLEPATERSGVIPTVAVGGGFTLGFGVSNATGTGGSFALRLAHVASRRALVHVELVGAALFSRVENTSGTYRTDSTAALVGAQYYVNRAVWVRIAAGVGSYHGEELRTDGSPMLVVRKAFRDAALASSVGAGFELFQIRHLHAGVEVMSTSLATSQGLVSSNALLLSVSLQ